MPFHNQNDLVAIYNCRNNEVTIEQQRKNNMLEASHPKSYVNVKN